MLEDDVARAREGSEQDESSEEEEEVELFCHEGGEESDDDDDDDDDNDQDSDDDDDFLSSPVHMLNCRTCTDVLSERGMQVYLVSDVSSKLYSTDIPSGCIREGTPRVIPTCECHAVNVHCSGCEKIVGYHVLQPCALRWWTERGLPEWYTQWVAKHPAQSWLG